LHIARTRDRECVLNDGVKAFGKYNLERKKESVKITVRQISGCQAVRVGGDWNC
jgi:hypothetical protein